MKRLLSTFLLAGALFLAMPGLTAQAKITKTTPTLNHIALYVVDLKKSTYFYQKVIQLDTIPEPFHDGRHTWFSIGPSSHLHLIQGAKDFSAHEKHNHLCFSVSSVKDFVTRLKNNNIEYENLAGEKQQITKRVDGVFQVYFKDPDGFWIEVNDATQ